MRRRDLLVLGTIAIPVLTGCQSPPLDLALHRPVVEAAGKELVAMTQPSLGRLAFVREGDIWIKELPDGAERRITTNGHADSPHWSASGEWLGYRINQRAFWIVGRDGSSARHVTDIEIGPWPTAAWAPPGTPDRFAFLDQGSLVVEDADGSNRRQLVAGTPDVQWNSVLSFAWSGDGAWLAFGRTESRPSNPPGQRPVPVGSLGRIRADGTAMQQMWRRDVFPNGIQSEQMLQNGGAPILAAWANADQTILYWVFPFSMSLLADGTALDGIAASGGQQRSLVPSMLANADFLAVAPNGKSVALTVGGGRETWTNKRIAVVDLPSGQPTFLTDPRVAAFSPSWSPDSQTIAYAAGPDVGSVGGGSAAQAAVAKRHLWLLDPLGSRPRQLTVDPAYRDEYPQWSTDGRSILFVRVAQAQRQLWLTGNDGSGQRMVVDHLAPRPGPWDYYGYVGWERYFAWWRP